MADGIQNTSDTEMNPLRPKLKDGRTTYGMWVTVESPNVTEAAVAIGLDWVVIEMEHGHLDWGDVIDHIRVVNGSGTAAIVRVAEARRETIQRALDLGADGLIVPMISSAEEAAAVYRWGRYPPRGVRGVGGERCVKWGLQFQEYLGQADEETLLIPLLETRGAVEDFDAILKVEGLEAIFFGPADMSASYGHLGQWEGGNVRETILKMCRTAAGKGISSGILARGSDEAVSRREQGFRMIALGADINLILRSVQQTLDRLKGEQG